MKTMLAILGSPRKKGNIAKLLNIAIEQGKKKGYRVIFVDIYEKKINYCIGCMKCRSTNRCFMDDDIQEITTNIINCDYLVVACPTYWANIPAPLKNMFDRLVGVIMSDNNSMIPKPRLSHKQKYVLITSCNTPFPFNYLAGQSKNTIKCLKEILSTGGMTFHGKVVYPGVKRKNQISPEVKIAVEKLIKSLH